MSAENAEQIQAYVQEVTKELATEIKSEIREVINKVEDVLSESADSLETNGSLNSEAGKRYSIDFNAPPMLATMQQNQSYQPAPFTVYGSPGGSQFYQPMVAIPNQVTYQQLTSTPSLPTFTMGGSQQPQQGGPSLMHTNSSDSVSLMSDHVESIWLSSPPKLSPISSLS
ncbi:uncharacterized protein LOC120356537 [Nilaparvata lugens]|uniref:uncharacterized protein LOC120356537 n=1 Tax=Nilaparvata lugens TaxID=108931 RepID=UPI00193E1299|nr:uncharacterized protein LOC120356537 [Nilaparvata lugens]